MTDRERFFRYVKITPHCWEWTGCKNPKGYGWFGMGSRSDNSCRPYLAHRVSFELHIKKIPEDLHVCHKCDNPGCVNPEHLFIGTNYANVKDKVKKGRQDSKLTVSQVINIRKLSLEKTQKELAMEFKVTIPTISRIIRRKIWSHI